MMLLLYFVLAFQEPLDQKALLHGGQFPARVWMPDDYGAGVQNWGFLQTDEGLLYVANNSAVLEFDGVTWRKIQMPNEMGIQSLARSEGYVYVGGAGEFGRLESNSLGETVYRSFLPLLPVQAAPVTMVLGVYASEGAVYFRTNLQLYCWREGELRVVETTGRIFRGFSLGPTFYLQFEEYGLCRIVNGAVEPLAPELAKISAEPLYGMLPHPAGILAINKKHLRLMDEISFVDFPLEPELAAFVEKNQVYSAVRLSNGMYALGTIFGGLALMDEEGRLIRLIQEEDGLPNKCVMSLFEDRSGGLWCGTAGGIMRLELQSGRALYGKNEGLPGQVENYRYCDGTLYAVSSEGLFRQVPGVGGRVRFEATAGTGQCWDIYCEQANLMVAQLGLPLYQNGRVENLLDNATMAQTILPVENSPWLLIGTNLGIIRFEKVDGRWQRRNDVEGVQGDFYRLAQDGDGVFWAGSLAGPLLRLDFNGDIGQAPHVRAYQETLPKGFNLPYRVGAQIWLATSDGIWVPQKDGFRPQPELARHLAGNNVTGIHPMADGTLWVDSRTTNLGRATPLKEGGYHWEPNPLGLPTRDWHNNLVLEDGLLRMATSEGLLFVQNQLPEQPDWQALIRRVEHSDGTLLFGGSGPALQLSLPFQRNNLRFQFAAPRFGSTFQYRLEGYEKEWSTPTTVRHKEYTNLAEGNYRFRVRAVAVDGSLSQEGVYPFEVLPPWYRTIWAFLLYAVLLIAVIQLVIRFRLVGIHRINARLEEQVVRRTSELAEKQAHLEDRNQLLEQQKEVIQAQASRLEEMDALKTRFFTNITHEFRTPLTLIMGPMEDLLEDGSIGPGVKGKLELMLQNSRRLLSLINQLLDLSRLDAGRTRARPARYDLVGFTRTRVAHFSSLAETLGLSLQFQSLLETCELYFDGEMAAKILDNLLSNACKYTPAPGQIVVSVTQNTDAVEPYAGFVVADNGPGIAEEHQAHIFDRFYQASEGGGGRVSSGIGLAFVKELVALHGGEVLLQTTEGKGCRFEVRFPLGKAHFSEEQLSKGEVLPQVPDILEGLPITSTIEPEAKEDPSSNQATLLVVEDNPDVMAYVLETLTPLYRILTASNGKQGLEKALEEVPDIILSDVMMPEMDGFTMCRTLKQNERTSHIPIILLTAKSDQHHRLEGLALGADDYLSKPFNSRELQMRLANHIESRRRLLAKLKAQPHIPVKAFAVTDVDEAFLEKAVEITAGHMENPQFGVDLLAGELALSRRQLQRKLKALLGMRPSEFIRKQRMERAAALLRGNGGNISEVSWAVGFETPAHFSKLFKEHFGQTPSAYASEHGR